MIRNIAMASILLLALALTACTGGNANQNPDNTPTNNTTKAPPAPKQKTVTMLNYKFNPNTLTVPVGTPLVIVNKEPSQQNINIKALNIDAMIESNAKWSYTFNKAGEYIITNRLASNPMQLTLVVK